MEFFANISFSTQEVRDQDPMKCPALSYLVQINSYSCAVAEGLSLKLRLKWLTSYYNLSQILQIAARFYYRTQEVK